MLYSHVKGRRREKRDRGKERKGERMIPIGAWLVVAYHNIAVYIIVSITCIRYIIYIVAVPLQLSSSPTAKLVSD